MQFKRLDRYKLLQIFGDAKPHTWNEVVWFCMVRMEMKAPQIMKFLHSATINHT